MAKWLNCRRRFNHFEPVSNRWGRGRLGFVGVALVFLVFLVFLACLLLLIIFLLPLLSRQIAQLVQQLPMMLAAGQSELMGLPERYPDIVSQTQIKQVLDFIGVLCS